MKSILLASVSVVAFAGAAAAEVTFSGDVTLGYNDTVSDVGDNEFGFYWETDLGVTFTQEVAAGLTAGATFTVNINEDSNGEDVTSGDFLLSLTSDMGSLYYGKTDFAAQTYWSAAGDMEADAFSEADGEVVLRGETMFGGVTAGLSYNLADADGILLGDEGDEDLDQLSIGAKGAFGAFTFALAYQEEAVGAVGLYDPEAANGDFNGDEILGLSVGGSFAGADVKLAYASNQTTDESSTGVSVSYPVGPVVLSAYYVMEDDLTSDEDNYGVTAVYEAGAIKVTADYDNDQGVGKTSLDATYDLGNGLVVGAGAYIEDDKGEDFYAAAEYALGEGASLLVTYAEDGDDDQDDDEIGGPAYQEGLTIEASFEF